MEEIKNPFNWTTPILDGIPRKDFTERITKILKGGTHISMLGPRGLGKTTFVKQELKESLERQQGINFPPWKFIYIDLRNAISTGAFVVAIVRAISSHPDLSTRQRFLRRFSMVEKELGIDFKVIKADFKMPKETQEAILSAQLEALATVFDRLVIVFDEFQILANVPGNALSSIRVYLMGSEQREKITLVLTGSLRGKLESITNNDREAIWDQTHTEEIPELQLDEFFDYLQKKFQETGKNMDGEAILHLLALTKNHPKRTQQVAWYIWENTDYGTTINFLDVQQHFDDLIENKKNNADFTVPIENLLAGNNASVNEYRVLLLIAQKGRIGSPIDNEQYGLKSENDAKNAAKRLADKGIVVFTKRKTWKITDPLLEAWLKKENPLIG